MNTAKRISLFLAIAIASASMAPAAILTVVYKDFLNNPTNRGTNASALYADGTPVSSITPLPTATPIQIVATIDTSQPDTDTEGNTSPYGPGMQVFTPLSATLTVFLPSGAQTYNIVENFTSPYHTHLGENLNGTDLNRTDVVVFDLTNPYMMGHVGFAFIEDPWIDGGGLLADFAGTVLGQSFSATNLVPNTFSKYDGTGILSGPGFSTPNGQAGKCGEGNQVATSCIGHYNEPIKLADANGNPFWLALTDGDTNPGTYNATAFITEALRFQPLTPCRVYDSRNTGNSILQPQQTRNVDFLASTCNIPATAQAYSINVTAIPPAPLAYLTVFPFGDLVPTVSTLNSLDGRVKSNAAIVQAGTGGKVAFFPTNLTHLAVDINGYFVPASDPTALSFYPIAPCRVVDTRQSLGLFGEPTIAGQTTRNFPILSGPCQIPATAQAYSVNYTAIPRAGKLAYLTTYPGPSGTAQPVVSTLNSTTGVVTANAAIVPAGSDGSVNVFVTNNADVVMDLNGYFAPPGTGGQSLYTFAPCRVVDSRTENGGAPWTTENTVPITGSVCGLPTGTQAVLLNATVIPSAGALGYLTLWPDGQSQPVASTLNATDGAITSNFAIVPTPDGSIDVFGSNPTQVVLDTSGYFAP